MSAILQMPWDPSMSSVRGCVPSRRVQRRRNGYAVHHGSTRLPTLKRGTVDHCARQHDLDSFLVSEELLPATSPYTTSVASVPHAVTLHPEHCELTAASRKQPGVVEYKRTGAYFLRHTVGPLKLRTQGQDLTSAIPTELR